MGPEAIWYDELSQIAAWGDIRGREDLIRAAYAARQQFYITLTQTFLTISIGVFITLGVALTKGDVKQALGNAAYLSLIAVVVIGSCCLLIAANTWREAAGNNRLLRQSLAMYDLLI